MTNREDESKMELKLVPVEPTPEMVDAWRIAFHESYNGGKGDADYNGHIRVGLKAALSTPSQGERVAQDTASEIIARAVDKARNLHPYAGRPAWEQAMAEAIREALQIEYAPPDQPLDKKLAGVIRQLHALHHAFNMKGTNSVTMLRAINTLYAMEKKAKPPSPEPTSTLSPHIEGENDGGGK